MAKREKKVIITGVTREAADEAFAVYAKADAQSAKITADIELQCAKIREKYANKLAELEGEKEKAFDTLQAYATENQTELFTKKKSLEMAHGVIGFRTGTPKLKTLKGFTWASALQLVKEFLPGYVRQTEEIAKDKLLADRDTEDMVPQMAKCGIQVAQDETFYVEPKRRMRHETERDEIPEDSLVPCLPRNRAHNDRRLFRFPDLCHLPTVRRQRPGDGQCEHRT